MECLLLVLYFAAELLLQLYKFAPANAVYGKSKIVIFLHIIQNTKTLFYSQLFPVEIIMYFDLDPGVDIIKSIFLKTWTILNIIRIY